MGFEAFFDTTFAKHVDISQDHARREAAVYRRLVAAGRLQRDAQLVSGVRGWSCAARRDRPLPDFLLRAFPSGENPDTRRLGDGGQGAAPIQLEASTSLSRSPFVRLPTSVISRRGKRRMLSPTRSSPSLAAKRQLLPRHNDPDPFPSRSAARLAAVQALYQHDMEGTPLPRLLKEFHDHRLGATIEDATYHDAERDFFDDIVTGAMPAARNRRADQQPPGRGLDAGAARPADAGDPPRRRLRADRPRRRAGRR